MRNLSTIFLVMMLGTSVAAGADRKHTAAKPVAVIASASAVAWSQLYNSEYGEVKLTFRGDRVIGSYVCCGTGSILGVREGNLIRYRWKESNGAGAGYGIWAVMEDGSLRGTWGTEKSEDNGGEWNLSPYAQLAK
jgi:hypothetical protein